MESTQTVIKRGSNLSAQEIYQIVILRNAVFIVELNCPVQDTDGEDLLSSVFQLMTTCGDRTVAHLRMHLSGDAKTVHIRRVVVAKDFRGKALGRDIMLKAINWCREHGVKLITLGARAHLQKFYSSLGFTPVGELYFHEEIAVWQRDMELHI